jgi:hypothetical protein
MRELRQRDSDYIDRFHNIRRRHSALGMLTPTEYEENFHNGAEDGALGGDLSLSRQPGKVITSTTGGPFGPVDPAQPASQGGLAGVEPRLSVALR